MIAVGLDFETRKLTHRECEPPSTLGPHDVIWQVLEVGVCGTDRDLATFHRGYPPPGEKFLTIGHEAVGRVFRLGADVTDLQVGDWVVPTVRRGCPLPCLECRRGRRDLCTTGKFTERGIFGRHGYFTEFAVDAAADLIPIPQTILSRAILVEPLSVVEKTIATALRLHPATPRTALIFGAGPVGLLTALALEVRGIDVTVHSLEDPSNPRAVLLTRAGIRYRTDNLEKADIVIEAAGSTQAAFRGLSLLAPNGVCAVLGAHNGDGHVPFLDMIIGNKTVFGSVNAHPGAFDAAVKDIARFSPQLLDSMLTRKPWRDYGAIVDPPAGAIKVVHTLSDHLH
ncbi:MAG: alcohol dehydrogenase catalytic domain-containing protein [Bryobacterales bacterium]|nr:alcohol dehydrogenase catalytic domain-containing protein [Bryobacterales bacterium]